MILEGVLKCTHPFNPLPRRGVSNEWISAEVYAERSRSNGNRKQ